LIEKAKGHVQMFTLLFVNAGNVDLVFWIYFQIRNLKERGMEFMTVPDTYYQQLKEKLKFSKVKIVEDFSILEVRQYIQFK